ncbi:hypothetical protein BH18ACT4_BH18ACT4_02640 [soil metagenome]
MVFVLSLAVVLPVLAVVMTDAAAAQQPPAPITTTTTTTTTTTSVAEGEEDDEAGLPVTFHVVDRKGNRERDDDEPVEGAVVTVTDIAGDEVDEVETDDEGEAEVRLPGPGQYTATLDLDSLPDDVGLPAEGGDEITIDPNRSRIANFNLGERQRDVRTRLDEALQLMVEGVKFGLIIAITAVGLSLIFGTTGLTNFAHGELVTFGAIVAWFINIDGGIQLIPATVLAMLVGGIAGGLLDLALWRPLRRRGVSLIAMLVISIGLSLLLRNLFQYWFGESSRAYGQYFAQRAVDVGPISISPKDVWSIVVSVVVLVAVAVALQRTKIGKAMRAVADNPDLASASGIDVDRVIVSVWVFGGALATLGGVLQGLDEQVRFDRGFSLLLLMFAGVTLGGLGTAYGALLGSFIVGLFVQVSTLYIPSNLKNVGALVVLILILLVRPQGILGRAERIG